MAHLNITISETNKTHCGGSIISTRTILTAAHCTFGVNERNITVRIGSRFKYYEGELFRVEKVINHPDYNQPEYNYDFALLILAREIILKRNVKSIIKLPKQDEKIKVGEKGFVTGWGKTLDTKKSSLVLRGIMIPIMSQSYCKDKSYEFLTEQMFCAGYKKYNDNRTCTGKNEKIHQKQIC